MRFLRNPIDYASLGNYVAPGRSWDGFPSRLAVADSIWIAGATPDLPIPADVENAREAILFDAMAVQTHAALTSWSTFVTASGAVTQQFILPIAHPAMPAAPVGTMQKGLLIAGAAATTGFTTLTLAPGLLGLQQATPAAVGFQCLAVDFSVIFGEITGGGGGGDLIYSTNWGGSWTAATSVGNAGTITAVHKAPGGHYLAAYDGNVYRATALSGTWAHTVVHSHDTAINFVDNGSTVVMLANFNGAPEIHAWYSLDDGVTWTSATNFGASTANASITYSKALGLFVVVNGNGELWTSADGISWTKIKTAAGLNPQLPCGPNTLAAIGSAICAVIEFGPLTGNYLRGIAYTCDLGASWYFAYFGQTTNSLNKIQMIRTINGRLFAIDQYNVFVSGQLETRDAPLYTGV